MKVNASHKNRSKIKSLLVFLVVCIVAFFICWILSDRDEALAKFDKFSVYPSEAGVVADNTQKDCTIALKSGCKLNYSVLNWLSYTKADKDPKVEFLASANSSDVLDGPNAENLGYVSANLDTSSYRAHHWIWKVNVDDENFQDPIIGKEPSVNLSIDELNNGPHGEMMLCCSENIPAEVYPSDAGNVSPNSNWFYKYDHVTDSPKSNFKASAYDSNGTKFLKLKGKYARASAYDVDITFDFKKASDDLKYWKLVSIDDPSKFIKLDPVSETDNINMQDRFKVVAVCAEEPVTKIDIKLDGFEHGRVESVGHEMPIQSAEKYKSTVSKETYDNVDCLQLKIEAIYPQQNAEPWMFMAVPEDGYVADSWTLSDASNDTKVLKDGDEVEVVGNSLFNANFEEKVVPDPDPEHPVNPGEQTQSNATGKIVQTGDFSMTSIVSCLVMVVLISLMYVGFRKNKLNK